MKTKKPRFSKLIVITVIALNVLFTREVFSLIRDTGIEPSTLIISWFAFTGTELWALSKIERDKNKDFESEE